MSKLQSALRAFPLGSVVTQELAASTAETTAEASAKPQSCQCLRCLRARDEHTMFGDIKLPVESYRMIGCALCGNKRCSHSDDHDNPCSGSNEPGQPGSRYTKHQEGATVTKPSELTAPVMTLEEHAAALRFCETCEDGQGYDVPKSMMKRLTVLGLVTHNGGGWYEGTPALDALQKITLDHEMVTEMG